MSVSPLDLIIKITEVFLGKFKFCIDFPIIFDSLSILTANIIFLGFVFNSVIIHGANNAVSFSMDFNTKDSRFITDSIPKKAKALLKLESFTMLIIFFTLNFNR